MAVPHTRQTTAGSTMANEVDPHGYDADISDNSERSDVARTLLNPLWVDFRCPDQVYTLKSQVREGLHRSMGGPYPAPPVEQFSSDDNASATTYNAAVEHAFNSNMVTDPNTQATPLQEAYAESKSYVSRTSNAKSKLACWDSERQAGNRFKKEAKLLHLPCPQDREYKC